MRITTASALVAAITTAAATTAFVPPAHAADNACWYGVGGPVHWQVPITGNIDVPVYINTSDTHGIQWSGYNSYDYIFSVWAAISRWNEQAGSRVRLRYAGTVDMGELDQSGPLERAVYVYGNYPTDPGNQPWCSNLLGGALPLDPDDNGIIDYAWVAIPGANAGTCTPKTPMPPGQLVDILTHEFGHTFGRNDAYEGAAICNANHLTIMGSVLSDPTLFDQLEMQSVYGRRQGGSSRRRILTMSGGTWSTATTIESTARLSRPGPGTGQRNGPVQMAWRDVTSGGVMRMIRRLVPTSGSLGTATPEDIRVTSPISIAHSPGGTTVMAYVKENGLNMPRVCYRVSTNSGSTYGAETCNGDTTSNGVGVAYDPLTQMFVLGYTEYDGDLALRSIGTPGSFFPPRFWTFPGLGGAQGVSIACADTAVSGNGNCRIVYASRTAYGQPITWLPMAVTFNGFSLGTPANTTLHAQSVPAVAWFHGRFHMAFSYVDQHIYHYDIGRTGTSWTYRSTPVSGATGSWLSPPHLAPTTECSGDICATRLQLIWLQYQ